MGTRVMQSVLAVHMLASVCAGCAVGQKFSYSDASIAAPEISSTHIAAVAVLDEREYVRNGNKRESFVGLSRGGFGNPFDVNTKSGNPMASEMTTAIVAALRARGLTVHSVTVRPLDGVIGARQALVRSGADRLLLFTVNEWKTDTMARTGLNYKLSIDVLDSGGLPLARSEVAGHEVSGSSILSAEKDAKAWFSAKVAELFRDDSVVKALK